MPNDTATINPPKLDSMVPAGQYALYRLHNLSLPPPAIRGYILSGRAREPEAHEDYTVVYYSNRLANGDSPLDHLRFALQHEPLDLAVLNAVFQAGIVSSKEIEDWMLREPAGRLSRRAWFLYEFLTGQLLDILPAKRNLPYVDILDEKRQYTAISINSVRHRIHNNLLGGTGLCPTIRRTPKLTALIESGLGARAGRLMQVYPPEVLQNTINYLYTRETFASFEIEGEKPTRTKEQRFLRALEDIKDFKPNKEGLVSLQNAIVDSYFAAGDWRDVEIFVGERIRDYERVHFIAARHGDVPRLMDAWQELTERLIASPNLDPVLAAATAAFSFVFIHPFEDGNGRIHRFLMHYLLAQRQFTPPHVIFPLSTAILRQLPAYYSVLDSFSRPTLKAIDWQWADNDTITIKNTTVDLYRFFDATAFAEFLYEMVAETINTHLRHELDFLQTYYEARSVLNALFDMPNKELNQLTREILDNGGKLSKNKRKQLFPFLNSEQIQQAESAVQTAIEKQKQREDSAI